MSPIDHSNSESPRVVHPPSVDDTPLTHDTASPANDPQAPDDPFLRALFGKLDRQSQASQRAPRRLVPKTQLRGRKRIGQGGLGCVYEYYDRILKRTVALKIVKPSVMQSEGRLRRFMRERRITARLQHPSIPPVYHCGELADGRPYYSMRLVSGQNLSQLVTQYHEKQLRQHPGCQALRSLLDSMIQVCEAIDFAHAQGVVHRDLKPANIMVEADGSTFVVDWGLAREIGRKTSLTQEPFESPDPDNKDFAELTMAGQHLGTPDYMSPEQAAGTTEVHSPGTDIYGLGAMLFFMIAGSAPHARVRYTEAGLAGQLQAIATSPPPKATDSCSQAAPELASICEKAMSLNQSDRYASALEMKEDIARWQRREMVQAHRDKYTFLQKLEMFSGKYRKTLAVATMILVLLLGGTFLSNAQLTIAQDETSKALKSQQASNQQLLDGLEKFADAVMEDEVLASPQLRSLRNRLLSDLAEQYEYFSLQDNNTYEETMRAALGAMRLAQIDKQTGNLLQAYRSGELSIQYLDKATRLSPASQLRASDLQLWLDATLTHCDTLRKVGRLQEGLDLQVMGTSLLDKHQNLLDESSKLDYQARLKQSHLGLAYAMADSSKNQAGREEWFQLAKDLSLKVTDYRRRLLLLDESPANLLNLLSGMNSHALVLHKLNLIDEAVEAYGETFSLVKSRVMSNPELRDSEGMTRFRSALASNSVMTYRAARMYEQVESVGSEGVALSKKLKVEHPLYVEYAESHAINCGNLAEALWIAYIEDQETRQHFMNLARRGGRIWRFAMRDQLQRRHYLNLALDYFREGAEAWSEIAHLYPERNNAKGGAAIQYLRLSHALYWAGREEEALSAFKTSLKYHEFPERLEPLHGPNAFAVLTGFCRLLESQNADAELQKNYTDRFRELINICNYILITDSPNALSQAYTFSLLNDPLYQNLKHIDPLQELLKEVSEAASPK